MNRQAWRDFICSPDQAGRHLSTIGQRIAGALDDAIDLAALEDFLRKLNDPGDVVLLSDAVDLLTGGYAGFIRGTLPGLVEAMSNEVVSKQTVVGPGLRGNPLWGRTILDRMSGRLSPVQYNSRTSRRSYDLPENRLLRWLVADIDRAVARIARRVTLKGLHPELAAMRASCGDAEGRRPFGEIDVPGELTADIAIPTRRHRRAEYRRAAALAARRAQLSRGDEERWWFNVLSLLSVGWLEPLDTEKLFELYVLVLTMDVVADELGFGEPVELGLITAGRRHVALYRRDDVEIRIFYNQAPTVAGGTRYAEVVARHSGITGGPRRPDVHLVVRKGGRRRLIVVEAKETSDSGYISDSVYKVFGYLYDFADAYADEDGVRAVLVMPEGIVPAPVLAAVPLRVVSTDRRQDLAAALAEALA